MGGLQLPGLPGANSNKLNNFPGLNSSLANGSIGSIISEFMVIVFMLAGFLSFIWFAWGAFEYIFAGGSKEGLASARKRLTWSLVGLIIFIASFAVSEYAQTIIPQNQNQTVTNVRSPGPAEVQLPKNQPGAKEIVPANLVGLEKPVCAGGTPATECPGGGWTCLSLVSPSRCVPLANQGNPTCPAKFPVNGQTLGKLDYCYRLECPASHPKPIGSNCTK